MTEEMNFSEAAESSVDRKGKKIKSNKNFMQAFEEVYKKHKEEKKETLIWARLQNSEGETSIKLFAVKSRNFVPDSSLLCGFIVDGEKHSYRQVIVLCSIRLPSDAGNFFYLLDAYAIVEMDERAVRLYNAACNLKEANKLFAEFYQDLITNNPEFLGL